MNRIRVAVWVLLAAALVSSCAISTAPAVTDRASASVQLLPTPTAQPERGSEPVPVAEPTPTSEPVATVPVAKPTPTSAPVASVESTESTDPLETEAPFWAERGHVNSVAPMVASAFNIDEDPPTFAQIFAADDADQARELDECFDLDVRSRLGDALVDEPFDYTDYAAIGLRRSAGAASLVACVSPLRVRAERLTARVAGWNLYRRASWEAFVDVDEACIQELYPTDPDDFVAVWVAEMGLVDWPDERLCEGKPTEPTAGGPFVNPVEASIAARFGIYASYPSLGEHFFSEDDAAASTLTACFDREVRAAIGDDAVDGYSQYFVTAEAWSSPEAVAIRVAGSEALLACMPVEQVRAKAVARELDWWMAYVRPPGSLGFDVEAPCVQLLYSTDLGEFREQWLALPDSDDLRRGTCLTEPLRKEVPWRDEPEALATETGQSLAGSRGLTLQWISWEPEAWGVLEFDPYGGERYGVYGRQEGLDGDYVFLNGIVVKQSETELYFSGSIETRTSFLNDGATCIRSGTFTFLATGDRKFWRLQDQLNCDGQTTDYVDIYFG